MSPDLSAAAERIAARLQRVTEPLAVVVTAKNEVRTCRPESSLARRRDVTLLGVYDRRAAPDDLAADILYVNQLRKESR